MKLRKAIEEFEIYTEFTKSDGTVDFYKYYLNALDKDLGHLQCNEITNSVILKYIKHRKIDNPNVSHATINKHLITLKATVKYATGIKIEFKKLKERKKQIETVPVETSNKIFNYYQKHLSNPSSFRNYLFLKLLLDTGLRLSEIVSVNVNDIDFDSLSIHIKTTKTDVDRYVCFTEQTKKLLLAFISKYKVNKLLFFDFITGNKMTTSSVESFIYRLKNKLNIKTSITPHKWRHTFATNFVRSHGGTPVLMKLLGHSNLKTTEKYLHLNKNDIVNEYKKIMEQGNM